MDEQEKQDRQMIELLNELRIALPGVQLLFGFLLTVPFAQGFKKVNGFEKAVFYATLLATTISTICLIAPSATHRLRFHKGDRAYVIETAHKYTIAGLVFLALASIGALLLTGIWFARPLLRGGPNARR
jgi:spore maturation protein SpmA